jgi:hypothetical protein
MSDIEGKTVRVAASEAGQRTSFKRWRSDALRSGRLRRIRSQVSVTA